MNTTTTTTTKVTCASLLELPAVCAAAMPETDLTSVAVLGCGTGSEGVLGCPSQGGRGDEIRGTPANDTGETGRKGGCSGSGEGGRVGGGAEGWSGEGGWRVARGGGSWH